MLATGGGRLPSVQRQELLWTEVGGVHAETQHSQLWVIFKLVLGGLTSVILVVLGTVNLHFWRRQWHPTPVLLPGKSYGWRSLVGCSPWGDKKLDTTEWLHFHFLLHALEKEMASHSSVVAWRIPGMGEPGVLPSMGSHSQTWLKWLSSSSSSRPLLIPWHGVYLFITWQKLKFWLSTRPPLMLIQWR